MSQILNTPAVAAVTAATAGAGAAAAAAASAALNVANEKELNCQLAYTSEGERAAQKRLGAENDDGYSKAQQAHAIALQQIINEKQRRQPQEHGVATSAMADDELNEEGVESKETEHLLGGQEQQPVTKSYPTAAAAVAADNSRELVTEREAGNLRRHPVNPLGSKQSSIHTANTSAADLATACTAALMKDTDFKTDCKLELHQFPKEMAQFQNNEQSNEQNGSTIITTPTLLTPPTPGQLATNGECGGNGGAGGAGGAGGGGGSGCRDAATGVSTHVGAFNDGVYRGPKIWQYIVKHYPTTSQSLALLIIFLGLWILGYIFMPQHAGPSTTIMRLILLIVGAQVAGIVVTFLAVPDMLGMLFFGVLYTNLGWANFTGYQKLEAFLREMALINIMLLAGFGLDANAFKKLWFMILRLTLIPTIAEVATITLMAHFLLNMSWLWGILLGLVITAVSPNVVVTVMLKLKEEGLGLNNGIHTLIYAMTTCNDVVAIFLFGVCCGIIFSTGTFTEQILQGPIGIGIGIVFGYAYGLMLRSVPSRKSNYVNGLRFVLTVLGGTIAVMGSKAIGYPSAGALGCVTVAFVAGIGWKRQEIKLTQQQQQGYENANVGKRLDLLWKFLKPVSFSLIGKEINFAVLDGTVVAYGLLLVLLGCLFRLAFAYLSTYGGNLTRKERGYITIASLPKATVQAALGPIALDLARSLSAGAENLSLASNVLIISVLAIIFTAPLGAILMLRLAPVWLERTPLSNDNVAEDNGRTSEDMTNYITTINFHSMQTAGSGNLDRHQKSV